MTTGGWITLALAAGVIIYAVNKKSSTIDAVGDIRGIWVKAGNKLGI